MEYKTSDIYLATALVTSGFPLLDLDRTNGQRMDFCFENSPKILETVDKFWASNLIVEPQTLLGNLKKLKSRIYNS